MPLKKSAGVKGREREKEGDRKRGGGVQKELWSCRKKKKKKQNSLPNDTCFDFVWQDTGQERQRERESSVCVQKYFTSRGGLYCRANG